MGDDEGEVGEGVRGGEGDVVGEALGKIVGEGAGGGEGDVVGEALGNVGGE